MSGKKKYSIVIICIAVFLAFYGFKRVANIPGDLPGPQVLDVLIAEGSTQSFFVLGDSGTGDEKQAEVAAGMEKICAADNTFVGILLLGDNFYQTGVQSKEDPQWQSKFEVPYGSACLSKLPVYAVLGNHDYKGNIKAQIEYHSVNPRWNMPHRYYAVTFGSLIQLVAFDSLFPDFCFSAKHCAVDFLRERLHKVEQFTWNIVFAHSPIYSNSKLSYSHRGGIFGKLMRPMLCPNVDVWANGHAHHLEHAELPGCKTSFLTVGGGGADLYGVRDEPTNHLYIANTQGFAVIAANPQKLVLRFYQPDAFLAYEHAKTK